jgi:putative heme-binding domain-containing protein
MKRLLTLLTVAAFPAAAADIATQATAASSLKVKQGFKSELLYSVPKDDQGSWVAMTQDDKGRLIVSDQYGALYRITVPALAASADQTKVERIPVDFGHCQGLLWAFGSLYGVVNDGSVSLKPDGAKAGDVRGLYRITDTNADDQLDKVEFLKVFPGQAGEHGPHGIVLSPDGQSLYIVCGNQTPVPPFDSSRVPTHWDEDQITPMLLGRGFMRDVKAPGGWVMKTDKDGKTWELMNTGNRNTYDIAFNKQGDLFGYDADMEWDTNTPWYRPTRVTLMPSGGEHGWRTCSKKWPVRWEDNLPPVVNIGPGSPTGVSFGYGAKFPAKYQDALYICDWSYGKVHAVHMSPDGASYEGSSEEFISGSPFPVTDLQVGLDGALYITIGGRKVQSGLYRVTYTGTEATTPAEAAKANAANAQRRELEALHEPAKDAAAAIDKAWASLGHKDRFIRFAARIALEHQPVAQWQDRALSEKDPRTALTALMALIRSQKEAAIQPKIIAALNAIDLQSLKGIDRVTLVRNYWLTIARHGQPDAATAAAICEKLPFPAKDPALSRDIAELHVVLGSESIVAKAGPLVNNAPTQEEQIDYARILRIATKGWTQQLRSDYFRWFLRAANFKGGASFDLFIGEIKANALATLSDAEKAELADVLNAKPEPKASAFTVKPMQFVKAWTLEELNKSLGVGLEGNRDFANGRNMFGAATCFACHRFNSEGGAIGPDLTSVAGKYSPRDLLEHILDPSKEISDQYGSTVFTLKNGNTITGRIANMKESNMMVCTNMMDPNNFTNVDAREVVKTEESKVSMMPPALLYMLKEDDILDLLAYLLSKGNAEDPMFKQ